MSNLAERTALHSIVGLIAGVVATGPMTIATAICHRQLPLSERYPLPPREITIKVARELGLLKHMNSDLRSAATLVAHFAYGGAAGAIYGAIDDVIPGPTIVKGMTAGLAFWAASYLGWLPGAGVLKPATEHPARRNILMIAAHLVWGPALAGFTKFLKNEIHRPALTPLGTSPMPHRDVWSR